MLVAPPSSVAEIDGFDGRVPVDGRSSQCRDNLRPWIHPQLLWPNGLKERDSLGFQSPGSPHLSSARENSGYPFTGLNRALSMPARSCGSRRVTRLGRLPALCTQMA